MSIFNDRFENGKTPLNETNLNEILDAINLIKSTVAAIETTATPTNGSTKPFSAGGAYQQLALKANLASPAFSGTPTAPTAASNSDSTQIATTAFVKNAISNISSGSGGGVGGYIFEHNIFINLISGGNVTVKIINNNPQTIESADALNFYLLEAAQALPANGIVNTNTTYPSHVVIGMTGTMYYNEVALILANGDLDFADVNYMMDYMNAIAVAV